MTDAPTPGGARALTRSLRSSRSLRSPYLHPAWALLFAGVPLAMGWWAGALFIDDAYITFRYAENIARGHGFVYNAAPLLGTTAPFYCLILAGFRLIGIPVLKTALAMGVASAAAAPLIAWRIGKLADRPLAGFIAALLLSLFPWWWLAGTSGMETTLAGALVLAAIYLDLAKRPAAAGVVSALLVLTRPDAAFLPALIFILRFLNDRKRALRFAAAGAVVLVPWLIFAALYFGSPLPQSLAAKRLIHRFPVALALGRYFGWFAAITQPPGMVLMAFLWLIGAGSIIRQWRGGLVLALWPPLFLIGLALTGVGPFFWYKVPAVPAFFFVAAYGADMVLAWRATGFSARGARALAALGVAGFIVAQMAVAWPYLTDRSMLKSQVEDVDILKRMADKIKELAAKQGKAPAGLKVYVGEVGIIGYELMDGGMIDSAGINSREVYEIRKRDWERVSAGRGWLTWQEQWAGSPEWSREVVRRYQPDFIASNLDYLHLRTLAREPWFKALYGLAGSWQDSKGQTYVLLQRTPEQRPENE